MRLVTPFDMLLNPSFKMMTTFTNTGKVKVMNIRFVF